MMTVKTAKIAPNTIVSFDKSASMPPALPPNTWSAPPPMEPPIPALLPDCKTIVAIKITAMIASITINTVNNSNTPPTFLSVSFYHSEKLCAMIYFCFLVIKAVCRLADRRLCCFYFAAYARATICTGWIACTLAPSPIWRRHVPQSLTTDLTPAWRIRSKSFSPTLSEISRLLACIP